MKGIHNYRIRSWRCSILTLVALIAGLALSKHGSYAAPAAPAYTISRYMSTTDTTTLYNEGCSLGRNQANQGQTQNPNGVAVVLDFGQPSYSNGQYGTMVFSNSFRSTAQIEAAAKAFLQGYWDCTPPWPYVRLAIGTSNLGAGTNYNHGKAWGQMVNNVNTWIQNKGYASQEAVRGASDMELGWNTPALTRAWTDGYASVSTLPYYNYGDCAGCKQSGTTSTPQTGLSNGWTQEDIWYVSWGSPPANPLPEIYTTNGSQASQWQQMSLYSYLRHGGRMTILGSFTQSQACQGQTCYGINNTPSAGWTQLYDKLNADSRTSQSLPYSTDITWSN